MLISALLTSAGINIGICVALVSFYSILRKQPCNAKVYFGKRLSQLQSRGSGYYIFERFVPSPGWLVKAWKTTEDELLSCGGVDAVAFRTIIVLSIRIFSIAAVVCIFLILPLNYFGKGMLHQNIHREDLHVFTIGNVKRGSKWLWAHCLALYIITGSVLALLYGGYKKITEMRLAYIVRSSTKPNYFTVLVRSVPWSPKESYSDTVRNYFTKTHGPTYLTHQMIYKCCKLQKLMDQAATMCTSKGNNPLQSHLSRCGFCWGAKRSFTVLSDKSGSISGGSDSSDNDDSDLRNKECAAALVFFKTRYAATVAARSLHSSNPMLWVTDKAPTPRDMLWKNLSIPYKQMWVRKLAALLAAVGFMVVFIFPVTLVQGLLHLDGIQKNLPRFLNKIFKNQFTNDLVTGYLPSVILLLFLLLVPPTMMLISTIEGHFSRSNRKRSACIKILFFYIWNVFFVNVLSGKLMERVALVSSPKDITAQLASAVPQLGSFFVTYVLTSGWASLSFELIQPFPLFKNSFYRCILRKKDFSIERFPYHTEIPRVLLLGVLGLIYSIMSPLMLPFVLIYYGFAYLVYTNQILNVYVTPYQSGGRYWPLMHNTFIFALCLTQIISAGVFLLKKSPVVFGFTLPLIIATLLYSEYCRHRLYPIFKNNVAEILIEMDRKDEEEGRMEEIHKKLHSAYCQFPLTTPTLDKTVVPIEQDCEVEVGDEPEDPEDPKPGIPLTQVCEVAPHSTVKLENLDLHVENVLQQQKQRRHIG